MSNINDYLLWRGDLRIDEEHPFNEIDSMIMARLSYLIFHKIDLKATNTIEELSSKMSKYDDPEFNYLGDRDLIVNLGKSKRFKDMIVSNYIHTEDLENEKQFCSITIHISYDEMYISYEGTDKTINGWKEDFNLAFLENIPAQLEGVKYLEEVANEYNYKKIRLGGHSKGGNIAIYSALYAPEQIKNRIIKVDNFDGPGMSSSIMKANDGNIVADKIDTYIPQDSVIGRLLEHKKPAIVVFSTAKGIYQHDIYSWQVLRDNVVHAADGLTQKSDRVNVAVEEWLKGTSPEQRKMCIDSIYELLSENEITSTIDLQSTLIRKTPLLIKTYKGIPEEDRKTIIENAKVFIKSLIKGA